MTCNFLIYDEKFRLGCFCSSAAPCMYLHLENFSCPCIKYARAYEDSIRTKEYMDIAKKRVDAVVKSVTVTK